MRHAHITTLATVVALTVAVTCPAAAQYIPPNMDPTVAQALRETYQVIGEVQRDFQNMQAEGPIASSEAAPGSPDPAAMTGVSSGTAAIMNMTRGVVSDAYRTKELSEAPAQGDERAARSWRRTPAGTPPGPRRSRG